jgi:hypothetical protein
MMTEEPARPFWRFIFVLVGDLEKGREEYCEAPECT